MSFSETVRRRFDLMVSEATTGDEVRQFLADEATANVAEMIDAGEASPRYRTFTNGIENAPLNTVNLGGDGSIGFLFSSMAECALFALDYAVRHSPRLSGDYQNGWYLLVDTRPWTNPDLTAIPLGAEVTLSNHMDYHRKIDVGGQRMSVAPQIIEQTRQAVLREFPTVTAERIFITIPGGYVLRGPAIRSGISYDKKTKGLKPGERYFQRFTPRVTNRKDSRRGEVMTYPSLVMSESV